MPRFKIDRGVPVSGRSLPPGPRYPVPRSRAFVSKCRGKWLPAPWEMAPNTVGGNSFPASWEMAPSTVGGNSYSRGWELSPATVGEKAPSTIKRTIFLKAVSKSLKTLELVALDRMDRMDRPVSYV